MGYNVPKNVTFKQEVVLVVLRMFPEPLANGSPSLQPIRAGSGCVKKRQVATLYARTSLSEMPVWSLPPALYNGNCLPLPTLIERF